jgi:hypothetical protein
MKNPAESRSSMVAAVPGGAADPSIAMPRPTPWWRVGMVWLVFGGPAVVVVASLGTAVVAYRGADVVLLETASARDVPVRPTGQTPALTARNHAATAAAGR